jgi:predicted nucleic-acid-binding protein
MFAVDTNIVVRYLVNDSAAQAARARRLVEREDIFVPLTVLLETEWVLRGVYGFTSPDAIHLAAAQPHEVFSSVTP